MPTLFSGRVEDYSAFDQRVIQTALAWQVRGEQATFQEMRAISLRVQPNRAYVLYGRIASAGEQLGLAGAAYRDACAWLSSVHSDNEVRPPARALAEIASYYALAAAHGLVNVTARLLAFDNRSRAVLTQRFKASKGFPPFDEKTDHWLAFNAGSVTGLEQAVDHHRDEVREIVGLLRTLVEDDRWTRLVERRNTDFHRWRPQSVAGGVEPASPWIEAEADGERFSVLTVYQGETLQPDDHRLLIAEAGRALDALEAAMRAWNELFDSAEERVTTFVLAEAMSGVQFYRDREPR